MKTTKKLILIILFLSILVSAAGANDKNMEIHTDFSYVSNNRTLGSLSSDQNLAGQAKIIYFLGENSRLELLETLNLSQILSNETQSHDLKVAYSSALGTGKIFSEIAFRPFTDTSNANNTNAETRFSLNYDRPIDLSSKVVLKGYYKTQSWNNRSTLNYNLSQLGLNYQKNLSETQNIDTELGYSLQGANTATNAFSDLRFGISYGHSVEKERKINLTYRLNSRNYPSNPTSSATKNEVNLNLGLGITDLSFRAVQYSVPANASTSYSGLGVTQSYTQRLSEAAKWSLKNDLLFQGSATAANNFTKFNTSITYDQFLSENQSLQLSNLLESTFYSNTALSYYHDLLGLKYEVGFSESSILSLGERFTLDNYPNTTTKNANRHQIDLSYRWPILPGVPVILSGGYEIKTFSSPSAAQSDYNAASLSANLDYKFSPEGKASLALLRFLKKNLQNPTADTHDTNITLRLAYNF